MVMMAMMMTIIVKISARNQAEGGSGLDISDDSDDDQVDQVMVRMMVMIIMMV